MANGFGGASFGGGGGGSNGGGGGGFSGGGSDYYGDGQGGCFQSIVSIVVVLAILGVIALVVNIGRTDRPPGVQQSTHWREPLAHSDGVGGVGSTGWDEQDAETLRAGMASFYERTGVVPHVYYITVSPWESFAGGYRFQQDSPSALSELFRDYSIGPWEEGLYRREGEEIIFKNLPTEEEAEAFAEKLYGELFDDGAHMLVLYLRVDSTWRVSGGEGPEEQVWYYCGEDASTVVDGQAGDIFIDYVAHHRFEPDRINAEVLSRAFSDAGERIMGPPHRGWVVPVCIGAVAAAGVVTALVVWRRRKNGPRERRPKRVPPPGEL